MGQWSRRSLWSAAARRRFHSVRWSVLRILTRRARKADLGERRRAAALRRLSGACAPYPDGAVIASRGESGAVGRKRHRGHLIRMAFKVHQFLSRGEVPELDGAVDAAGDDSLPVG